MKIGELFFGIGLDVDQVKLNDVVKDIGKLNVNSLLAAVGIGAMVDGLKQIMDVGSNLTEPLYKFNQETGLSGQRMQQWSEYAQKFGASGDMISSSLAGLQKKMAAMKFGDSSLLSGIYLLQQAGANINQADLNDPFSFLGKATEGLQKIKPELRTYVAGLLGLNDQLLLLKSFNGADQMPAPTPEQIQNIRDYNSAWTETGIMIKQVMTDIASEFAPDLKNLAQVVHGFFTQLHEDGRTLRLGIEEWVGIIALFTGPLGQVGYILAMISLHLKEIKDFGANLIGVNGVSAGDLWKSDLQRAPGGLGLSGGSKGNNVTQHNAITIIAHNIEDIEHKFVAFMEKTIAKSFYQNSQNY